MTTELETNLDTGDTATRDTGSEMRWPAEYLPGRAKVFVSNEIVIPAAPEVVWAWLIRAGVWPEWYPNARQIHFRSISGPDLRARARFSWRTFGIKVFSQVLEFEPYARLAWDKHGIGFSAYHGWVLTPRPDGSTHVLTEETQTGWLAKLRHTLMPKRMFEMHQIWLDCLSLQAQTGLPPQGR